MRFAKVSGMVGVVAGVALAATACGGGSGSKKAAAPASPAGASAPSAPSAPGSAAAPDPSASASPSGPDGAKYLAAFLQPATFEAGLDHVTGYPNWDNAAVGDVHGLATLDCYTLENGGEASGSTMQAYDLMVSSGPNQDFATQKAYTFGTGDALKMMQYVQYRVDTDCAAFDHTPTSGPKIHTTMTEKAVSGLGDQAIQVTATDTPAGGTATTLSALLVRYGDNVLYVSFSNADAGKATSFDLTSREKTIAQNLHLG